MSTSSPLGSSPASPPAAAGSPSSSPGAAGIGTGTGTGTGTNATVGRWTLAALVVGSMVGAGVFSLPGEFAMHAGGTAAMAAWTIAGSGTLMIALTFLRLAQRRPDLDAGVYSYAREGFGRYPGFLSALGYYLTAVVGNAAYWVLIMSTVGEWVPALKGGATPLAVLFASAGVWGYHLLLRRGVREAASINRIVTVAKLIPLVAFVVIAVVAFDPAIFADNLGGGDAPLLTQVRGSMLVTVFVFIGVEGASVYSRYARTRRDIGWATITGFLGTLALFALITMVAYGVMSREDIAKLDQPSISGVLESVVGPWGAILVGVGLLVSVLGAYLAWTLMGCEVVVQAARTGDMPAFLLKENSRGAQIGAITATNVLVQAFLLVVLFASDAFNFAVSIIASLILVPYALSAGFAVKTSLADRRAGAINGARVSSTWIIISFLTLAYAGFLIWAGGVDYLLLTFAIYAPFSVVHVWLRGGLRGLTRREQILLAGVVALGVLAVALLVTGHITV